MNEGGRRLEVADYVVFALMLALSAAIGLFYVIKDRRKQNTNVYLMGGRSMSPYPVAFSLTVGFISAILILGVTSDVYRFGGGFIWFMPGSIIGGVIIAEIYIPTFYKAKVSTAYEYLEKRFNRAVRIEGTLIYMALSVLYIGISIYAPSLALNVVTGMDLWGAVVSTGFVCILYSSMGGLKAVIWTDVLQFVIMMIGLLSILIQGSIMMGGYGEIWKRSREGGRIDIFDFDASAKKISSVWSCGFSGAVTCLAMQAVNQGQVQRYLSCGAIPKAKTALWFFILGASMFYILATLVGFTIYAYYEGCDPLTLGVVKKSDQILPYMVLDIFQHNPGMPGLFIACVYSGALSTVSTSITAMASVVVEDFLKPNFRWKEKTFTTISRILVVGFGLLCILFSFLTSKFGAILEAAVAVFGIVGGPLLGLYTLGILFPFINSIGALVGVNFGLAANVWVFFGRKYYPPTPENSGLLSVSTSECPVELFGNISSFTNTSSLPLTTLPPEEASFIVELYQMSPWIYSAFGLFITVVMGIIGSYLVTLCGLRSQEKLDPDLIYPFFDHWIFTYLPERFKETMRCGLRRSSRRSKEEKLELKQDDNNEDIESCDPSNQVISAHDDDNDDGESESSFQMRKN